MIQQWIAKFLVVGQVRQPKNRPGVSFSENSRSLGESKKQICCPSCFTKRFEAPQSALREQPAKKPFQYSLCLYIFAVAGAFHPQIENAVVINPASD